MMKKRNRIPVATLIVMLSATSVLYGCSGSTIGATAKAPRMQMQVVVQPVTKTDVAGGQSFAGAITPSSLTNLASKVNGKVTALQVNVGDHIKKGQALATIDTTSLEQSLQQTQGSAAVSEANYNKAQHDQANGLTSAQKSEALTQAQTDKTVSDQQASIASAKQQVVLAQAQLAKTQNDQQNSIASTKQSVQTALVQLDKARSDAAAAVASAQQGLDNATNGLQSAQLGASNNLAALQLSVQQAEAAYQDTLTALTPSSSAQQSALLKLQQAELSLQQAQGTSSGVSSAQNALTLAQAQLASAENSQSVLVSQQQYNQALTSLTTVQSTNNDVLMQQINQAELALANAQASANSNSSISQAQLAQAMQSLKTAQSTDALAVSQASLQQALTNVKVLSEQLQDGTLVSPVDGIVTAITAPVGQMAGSAVMSVAATDPILATVNVPEAEISKFKVGTSMDVTVGTIGKTYAGKVYAIHPTLDATTKSYAVDVKVDDTDHELLPGMFAQATLKSAGRQAIMVPADTVVSEASGNFVYVEKNNRVHKVAVQIGEITSTEFEITSGLTLGDQLVVKGEELLSDNVPVQVVTADKYGKYSGGNGGGKGRTGGSSGSGGSGGWTGGGNAGGDKSSGSGSGNSQGSSSKGGGGN